MIFVAPHLMVVSIGTRTRSAVVCMAMGLLAEICLEKTIEIRSALARNT
jgi:hypothetical protein